MPRESWKKYAGSARSRLRTKRVGAKPRRTRNAAGQSSASILHSAIIATDFAKAVPRAGSPFCFGKSDVIPRLAERAEGPRKRSIASALFRAHAGVDGLIFRDSANWQLSGPWPSTRLGMTNKR